VQVQGHPIQQPQGIVMHVQIIIAMLLMFYGIVLTVITIKNNELLQKILLELQKLSSAAKTVDTQESGK
jgi:hypothetical protein